MQFEFDLNEQLRNQERSDTKDMEQMKEDGKDRREKAKLDSKRFESAGNDTIGGGMGVGDFTPQIGK